MNYEFNVRMSVSALKKARISMSAFIMNNMEEQYFALSLIITKELVDI
jgi:hypothetical protein